MGNRSINFFPREHGNKFSNLIGSFCGPDFPISAHEQGITLTRVLPLFVLREFLPFKHLQSAVCLFRWK